MFKAKAAFSGFSVKDLSGAKEFYSQTLGLKLNNEEMGLDFELPGGGRLFIYQKDDHQPAIYTALNFVVEDIDKAIDELKASGVKFEIYDNMPAKQDDKGVMRGLSANMGPDIAWFQDPAGNILSILQEK